MKTILSFTLALLCCVKFYAQPFTVDTLFSRMEKQAILYPMEKVHLHTDRSTYVAGENIWIKAYVVDGITNLPVQRSRYVYVVLQNPFKEILNKVCLRADEDGFIHGNLSLPEDLPKGEYTLSAYTRYMENEGEESFFRKRITINSVMNNTIRMETKVQGSHLDILFKNPVTGEVLNVNNCVTNVASGEIHVQKKDNGYSVKFHESKEKVLLVQAGNYKEFVYLDTKPDFDVSFLPEGGNLVAGTMNRVAFKAVNSQGQGEDVWGTVRDERDSVLLSFHSLHRGMGTFPFVPQVNKTYSVICENAAGKIKQFTLPKATEGYGLQVNEVRGKYYAKVLRGKSVSLDDSLYILVHQQGWPVQIHRYGSDTDVYAFDADKFLQGSASFLLMNSKGQILNERMVFVHTGMHLGAKVTPEQKQYSQREKVHLSLDVCGPEGEVWNGEASVSVTDNNDVLPDSLSNILSNLLLESHLRGHIESPAWYFRSGNDEFRRQALDVLMMTQGWRRYDLERAWLGDFHVPSIFHEGSQSISGRVTRRVSRKPVENADVQMMIPLLGISNKLVTGTDGTFHFGGFEYPENTKYYVNAYTDNGKDNVVVELDTIVPPSFNDILPPYRGEDTLPVDRFSSDYLAKTGLRMLQENGMQHIFMDEMIVTASRQIFKTEYEKVSSITIKEEQIEQSGVTDFLTFLRQKYVSINWTEKNGAFVLTLNGNPVTVILDGTYCRSYDVGSQDFLRTFLIEDLAQIDVIHSPFSLAYEPLGNGVVAITTKNGQGYYGAKWHPTNLKHIMPLGFQPPVEFYSPRYELAVDKEKTEPDLRTTIHWQPRLEVKNGKAEIEFYTADGPVDYSVVIEGVGEDGSLLRVEKKIK